VCVGNTEKSKINYATEPAWAEVENACPEQKSADWRGLKSGKIGFRAAVRPIHQTPKDEAEPP
jgi:hypothetical protein